MCRISGCEQSTVSLTIHAKARKTHTCCECGRTISTGEAYSRTKSLYEGYWDTFKTCSHCVVAQSWLAQNCGGWVFEHVAEEIEEHAFEYPTIAAGLLHICEGMKYKWQRSDGIGIMPVPEMPSSIASTMVDVPCAS